MDWFSISVTVLIAVLSVSFIFMLAVNIVRNLRQGEKYRDELERRVNGLRLGAMAEHIGVSTMGLVHRVPVVDLHQQMERCGSCDQTVACDKALKTEVDAPAASVPSFCANSEQLTELAGAVPAAS